MITVDRPDRTVIVNKKYVYLTKKVQYHSSVKRSSPERILIGKLSEDGKLIPNKNYYSYFNVEELLDPDDRSDVIKVGPHFLFHTIAEQKQLDLLLKDIFGEDMANKLLDMAAYMIMNEDNKMTYLEDYGFDHSLFNQNNFNDSTIGRLFSEIRIKDIDLFQKSWCQMYAQKKIYVAYDSTNMPFSGRGIELAEFGHAKMNDELPQINVSLAYDQTDNVPLQYEVFAGSVIDNIECSKMLERARNYGCKDIGFIMDRGYFSKSNIRYLEENDFDYLLMTKGNAVFLKEAVDEVGASLRNGYSHFIKSYELYGTTVKKKLFQTKKNQYVHVYYDGARAEAERIEINKTFEKYDEKLEELKGKKIKRKEDLTWYEKYYKLSYDENGYFLAYQRKDKEIRKKIDRAGFFCLVSSTEMTAEEALDIYRDRDAVEKIFRMQKSSLGNDVFRVHSTASLESKLFVSFIALILRNEVHHGLKELYKKNRKEYTVPKALREYEKMYIVKLSDNQYHIRYRLTNKQKTLLKAIGQTEEQYNKFARQIQCQLN